MPQNGQVVKETTGPAILPLLTPQSLTYSGAFKLPNSGGCNFGFDYGGSALAFTGRNSLLAVNSCGLAAEVSIPNPTVGTLAQLPRATYLQPFADPFDGKRGQIGTGSAVTGGFLVLGQTLIATAYLYYDGNGSQSKGHFRSSLNLSIPNDAAGPYQIGTTPPSAGFTAGWMAPIPTQYQGALGGPALTGLCCIPIIGRSSLGPSATVFDPLNLGAHIPLPATTVLGYPIGHPTLGICESTGQLFNCSTQMGGMVFPHTSRSVLFFGRIGTGMYCYGPGTSNPALAGTPAPPNGVDPYCYDPSEPSKGPHSFPYQYEVWAYDVLELISVKSGAKQPWQVVPYQAWTFSLPFQSSGRILSGAAYDPSTKRIYVSQRFGDGTQPLIHAFTIP